MAPKNVFTAVIYAALLACNAASAADQYQADEFLRLDLSSAALSPKPLGPASGFTPVPAETNADRSGAEAQARLEPKVEPAVVRVRPASLHTRAAKAARFGSDKIGATAYQSARRPGVRHQDSGLALQVRRDLRLEAVRELAALRKLTSHPPVAKPSAQSQNEQATSVVIRRGCRECRLRFAQSRA